MNEVRRRLIRGLVAGLVTAVLVAWTPARQQPKPQSNAVAASSDTVQLDCTSCHPSVHATMVIGARGASARCITCHAGAHEAIQTLYTGKGADTALRPDRMFLARVECRSCHTDSVLAARAAAPRLAAITGACTSCHGTRFQSMLPRWNEGMNRRSRITGAYVTAATADRRLAARAGTHALLESAGADVALVVNGGGLHNVVGADALLRSAIRKVGSAYNDAGLPVPPPPVLGPDPATVSCAYCHYGVETVSDTIFGQTFNHADHVVGAEIACTRCHSSANYFMAGGGQVDPAHGKTTVTAAACSECHHVNSSLACTTCHSREALGARPELVTLSLHLQQAGAPALREVAFRHGAHPALECTSCHTSRTAVTTVASCTSCHEAHHRQAADCTICHGTKLLAAHTAADHLACAQCHARATLELLTGDRTLCLTCHVDRRGHHPSQECAPCHLQMSPAEVRARILGRKP